MLPSDPQPRMRLASRAVILIHLISAQLEHQLSVLRRLLVAILVGGNLQVPSGKLAGSTFTNIPLCTSATDGLRDRLFLLPFRAAGRLGVRRAGPGREP
jgi:hypothetical protein